MGTGKKYTVWQGHEKNDDSCWNFKDILIRVSEIAAVKNRNRSSPTLSYTQNG